MSADENILRLENAMATLAELSANQEQRTARLEESFRLLTQVVAEQQRHVTQIEESFVTLVELLGRHEGDGGPDRDAHGVTLHRGGSIPIFTGAPPSRAGAPVQTSR